MQTLPEIEMMSKDLAHDNPALPHFRQQLNDAPVGIGKFQRLEFLKCHPPETLVSITNVVGSNRLAKDKMQINTAMGIFKFQPLQ